ncbi:MAG: bifunctional UDP-N-acetylglucosamine diphosphorylase/glucosamine-1-phosphate N-acetyltransferase GlmU, partial [Bacillota bacterium]|nr:bifunctional UDP-N-acetylglucosamine diphosphorylase/glucosamine-1-phosphate N-acetyltransferase GlmU [Bacillota bacterium]
MKKAIILAAGKGTRMKSKLAKVLQPINGKAMISYVIEGLQNADISEPVIVVGHQHDDIEKYLGDGYKYAMQAEQLGTGHAVMMAKEALNINAEGLLLVVCGDTPLITSSTFKNLIKYHEEANAAATILTCHFDDPTGYGRIVRDTANQVVAIVEEKDADNQIKEITEINTGTYCFSNKLLWESLNSIKPNNAQGEYYLTDVIKALVDKNHKVEALVIEDRTETMGINNKVQLAEANMVLRHRKLVELMEAGVTIIDPNTTFIEDQVKIGSDTVIYPFSIIKGSTIIGEDCFIGPNAKIDSTIIGNNVTVDQSTLVSSQIGNDCVIGPYAYLRPDTVLCDQVKIGDFVEIKKSTIGT